MSFFSGDQNKSIRREISQPVLRMDIIVHAVSSMQSAKEALAAERYGVAQKVGRHFFENKSASYRPAVAPEITVTPATVIAEPVVDSKSAPANTGKTILDERIDLNPEQFIEMQAETAPAADMPTAPVVSLSDAREAKRQARIIESSQLAQQAAISTEESNERITKAA